MKKSKLLEFCLEWIQRIKQDMDDLSEDRAEAFKFYFAKKLGNEVEGRSAITTSDLSDTVEWIIPSLMKIFASGDEVATVGPRSQEDTETAEVQQELTNYQLRQRNNWYLILNDFFRDALLQKIGVIKYQWVESKERIEKTYKGLSEQELMALLAGADQDEDLEVEDYTLVSETAGFDAIYNVQVVKYLVDEYPEITAVPPEEVGFPKSATDVDSCPFLYHKTLMWPYEIKKAYGEDAFKKIKKAFNDFSETNTTDSDSDDTVMQERFGDLGGVEFWKDDETDQYWVYECYYRDKDSGDPKIVILCGDQIIEEQDNKYGRPPFEITTPVKLSHRMVGRSMFDLLGKLQELRTVLLRQILDNIYFTNLGRYIGDESQINMSDFLNNNHPGAFIRGNKDAIGELPAPQLQPWTFKLLEYVEADKEARTGVTKYNQGLDANSLNKTARGISAILGQSLQRIENMARLFAEMAIGPLVQRIVDMNTKFLKRETSIRVMNKWVPVDPVNLVGRYDVIVNVGIGTGAKDQVIAQMQQLLGIYGQLMQMGLPVATAENVYNAMKELVKAMGYRNHRDYVTDPQLTDRVKQLIQAVAPLAQQTQDMNVLQAIQAVAQVIGGQGGGQGGPQQQKQLPKNLPQEPAQPMQPTLSSDGGGYYG